MDTAASRVRVLVGLSHVAFGAALFALLALLFAWRRYVPPRRLREMATAEGLV